MVHMGLFQRFQSFFSGTKYQINREILKNYIDEVIEFAKAENLPFGDEFYLCADENSSERLHLEIINYDAPCDDCLESEKMLKGIIIFVNSEKTYNPESDEKYYTAEDLIDFKLSEYPEYFLLHHELAEPTSLEEYKIQWL